MEGIKVTHIMADGTECHDLSHYLDNHKLPDATIRILYHMFVKNMESVKDDTIDGE